MRYDSQCLRKQARQPSPLYTISGSDNCPGVGERKYAQRISGANSLTRMSYDAWKALSFSGAVSSNENRKLKKSKNTKKISVPFFIIGVIKSFSGFNELYAVCSRPMTRESQSPCLSNNNLPNCLTKRHPELQVRRSNRPKSTLTTCRPLSAMDSRPNKSLYGTALDRTRNGLYERAIPALQARWATEGLGNHKSVGKVVKRWVQLEQGEFVRAHNHSNAGHGDGGDAMDLSAMANAPNRPKKSHRAWKPWCRRHGACFECGSVEHSASDCTQQSSDLPP